MCKNIKIPKGVDVLSNLTILTDIAVDFEERVYNGRNLYNTRHQCKTSYSRDQMSTQSISQ